MFGLMRAKTCGLTADEKQFRRLHYCGTCKTIGSLYGQKARFLLNHDTIFLAEILTSLSEENVQTWQRAYQSYNCMSLPLTEMPVSLQFAATANLILTEFKLADKITDENSRAGKITQKAFSANFQKARAQLQSWKFPFENVRKILAEQEIIEAESVKSNETTAAEILEKLARPTAATTAIFFGEGVKLIGRSEVADSAAEIGFNFGKLIYLLDAFEDYEKDFRRRQFNAIRAAFRLDEAKLSDAVKRKIVVIFSSLESRIIEKIDGLPINKAKKELFAARLRQNLARKLEINLPVLPKTNLCQRNLTWKKRFEKAKIRAKELTANYSWAKALPVFVFVLAFAIIAPAQSREAKSARECFDLSFNLMFLGAIFGSALAFPKAILMENPEEMLTKKGRKKKMKQAANGDSGSDGWCDACDCCCCECGGENCCDGCDCCSGCCDNCDCGGCCDCSCD